MNPIPKRSFDTLRWRDGALEMLDQRALPERQLYLRFHDARGVADAIRDMVVRGAPAIGCAAAFGVALEALRTAPAEPEQFTPAIERAFEVLQASRPTAVNLFWALARMRARLDASSPAAPHELASRLLQEAQDIAAEDVKLNRRMGAYGAELLRDAQLFERGCDRRVAGGVRMRPALQMRLEDLVDDVVVIERVHDVLEERLPRLGRLAFGQRANGIEEDLVGPRFVAR